MVLKGAAGMTDAQTLSGTPGRALGVVNETLFAISGGTLYEITSSNAATGVAAVLDDKDTFIQGYGASVTIVAGGSYYVYSGGSLSTVTGGAFSSVGGLAYVGGYTVLTELDGSRFEWTTLQDPSTRNALYVATAEEVDDKIIQPLEMNGNLYLFGSRSVELWQTTGAAGSQAFGRISTTAINRGLKAKGLVTKVDNAAYFVGNDNTFRMLVGDQMQTVSTSAVETAISQGSITDVIYFEDEGSKHIAIRFSDRPSWVLCLDNQQWWERAVGTDLGAWNCVTTAQCYGRNYGLTTTGRLFTFTRGNEDLGDALIRRAISGTIEMDNRRFNVAKIAARTQTGNGGNIMMKLSRDRGRTFTSAKQRSLGGIGDYEREVTWRGQGVARNLTILFDISDAKEIALYEDAVVEVA